MKQKLLKGLLLAPLALTIFSCSPGEKKQESSAPADTSFDYIADRFADVQVLRYRIDGFDELTLQQKQLAYYLYQAGLSGRDIFYDQKYPHALLVRKTVEAILETYSGEKSGEQWDKFLVYAKRMFFANGIHHFYSADKMIPECSADYFASLLAKSEQSKLPLEGMALPEFTSMVSKIIFDPNIDKKTIDLTAGVDVVTASCNNFYSGLTQKEVEDYYNGIKKSNPDDKSPIGLNSQLVKENGKISERVWKSGGMYGAAIDKILFWLRKAEGVAENEAQKKTISLLIKFYETGDTKTFDEYSIAWVADTSARIDFVNGFIEVYQDAMQYKGSFEAIVSMKDMVATKRIEAISKEAQWFEDHSTIMDNHKKKNVKGITAKVITVISEVADAAPVTPIGINLPNNEWIREEYGSKSVSLGNIVESYNYYRSKSPVIDEFGSSPEVIERVKKYGAIAGDLHTDMHEVIGHASGQINKGVGTTEQTLKTYAGILEEARADLVGLYFCMDQKLIDIGVSPSLDAGKAQYDNYIMNGLMTQLNRIEKGKNLEEAHMRNRQLISAWALEKGTKDKVMEMVVRDGKTYIVINDYLKLRELFGQLLREIQRMKSEGDYEAGKNLVENYGVKVDQKIWEEVHQRYEKLNIAPYMGFIQPKLVAVMDGDKITDVKVEYPKDFVGQMLEYGKDYGFLPVKN